MPIEPQAVSRSHARALVEALAARDRRLDSLQTAAVMEYEGPDHHIKAREEIVVRRPDSLRVEAMSPFGVAVVVAASGPNLAIFQASNNTLMRGAASAETLNRFARIPLAPAPAVKLMMGLAPDESELSRPPDYVGAEDDLLITRYRSADGSIREFGFAGSNLALVRERDGGGYVRYEVRYHDYQDIGGIALAYRIEAEFPHAQTHVNFTLKRPIINGAIADSIFELTPGPKTNLVNLDGAPPASRS